jgi:hypothetical protein
MLLNPLFDFDLPSFNTSLALSELLDFIKVIKAEVG